MRAAILLLALALGCGPAIQSEMGVQQQGAESLDAVLQVPYRPMRFHPPGWYEIWWNEIQACSGLSGNFDQVKWFMVPNTFLTFLDGKYANHLMGAIALPEYHSIIVGAGFPSVQVVIQHEMLHELIGVSEDQHPPKYFEGPCKDLVKAR